MTQNSSFFKGKRVLIAGGTGLIGGALARKLAQAGANVSILTRDPQKAARRAGFVSSFLSFKDLSGGRGQELLRRLDGAVNLAGAGIADSRWSAAYKREIYRSRIETTKTLVARLQKFSPRLKSFISASSGGYYGEAWEPADENASAGEGFLAQTAQDWERAAQKLSSAPVALFRISFALSEKGGFLKNIARLARIGFTEPLGPGNQWMSWIDIEDLSGMLCFALKNSLSGAFNIASPFPVTARDFMEELCLILKPRLRLPLSAPLLRLAMGERAALLEASQNLSAKKITSLGFALQFPKLEQSLKARFKGGK